MAINTLVMDVAMRVEWLATPRVILGIGAGWLFIYIISKVAYALCLDPLRHIPGPRLNAVSMIPYARHLLAGTTVQNSVSLHQQYGEVVRIAPNEVSLICGETAFPDIYGFRTGKMKGHLNMSKDPVWYVTPSNGAPSILQANDEDHSRGRRVLAHAFSDKALMGQEPLVQRYVDQLIDRLKEVTSANDEPVDMVKWYNWTTFDVIADLLFGEPFGCLQDLSTHQYVALLFQSLKSLRMIYILAYYPWLRFLGNLIVDKGLIQKRKEYATWVSTQVTKRINTATPRPDFMSHILANNNNRGVKLTRAEIDSNATLMTTAGSETTATLLSGATYLLLTHPRVLRTLQDEIHSEFPTYESITLEAVAKRTPYLNAVISEALRFFPPIPVGFIRRVPKGGETVSGYWIPEGTILSVSHYAAYHSERNFRDPDSWVPERWLGDERYVNDKRAAFQPFSFGPRSCLGRNLAYAEMRLILAKMVWSFEMELDEGLSRDWLQRCRVMRLWQKPELEVRVRPRVVA
ncbi:cytochrome P450 [Aspergillus niger CBS 101883]|uniref:cytochrome P450 n=1 Tax=Aspergillus lacticoffeatus (strain CBS 101883) TaxID=1450533 RepID=UPI0001F26FCE|nr:toxin biosynthesis cytochrome P450 monooxygenase [Aspergillus niger CBS 513.88]XP_025457076.1 cytochrome P450 monooxygenase [Aspergillus niger CBS 101883]PYH59021.1 cytochrome P450 monooxygenase [Aspergillus niger CBS 101883]|eukprot:XP_001392495.2 toxin biosynthesis cytochrome P450 monooxygenase [Aspergillus niger CBS 513.88]